MRTRSVAPTETAERTVNAALARAAAKHETAAQTEEVGELMTIDDGHDAIGELMRLFGVRESRRGSVGAFTRVRLRKSADDGDEEFLKVLILVLITILKLFELCAK